MSIDRRNALRIIAGGVALASASSINPTFALAASPDIAAITGADPKKNVIEAIAALGGMKRFVSKGDVVVVKPNIGFGNAPIKTTTTEPRVVRTVAELALNAGAKRVLVIDNPCHKANIALEISGIKNELAKLDDTFAYTVRRSDLFSQVNIPKGKALKEAHVARDILEADVVIAVPVAKSHGSAKVSFGMKGWMGVVKNRGVWHFPLNLHQAIADMATYVKPKLTVLDATRALVTGGPGGPGQIAHLKTIVAGTDPVAVDAFGVGLAPWQGSGYKVEDIDHIMMASKLGVGTHDLSKLNILKKKI